MNKTAENTPVPGPAAALLIVDVQRAIDNPSWGPRNNPQAESNMSRLLAAWRAHEMAVIHIRHDSLDPHSTYRPGQPGNAFKSEVLPIAGETIIAKRTNSAFIGTHLEAHLKEHGLGQLVTIGVITNNSVEATVRMAGNLGFETFVVADATATVDKSDLSGHLWTAEEVHALSLANMAGEYATVLSTDEALTAVSATA